MPLKESDGLLPGPSTTTHKARRLSVLRPLLASLSIVVLFFIVKYHLDPTAPVTRPPIVSQPTAINHARPYAGSPVRNIYPPASPTNVFPSLFPTNVGHSGSYQTGAEAALVATAPSYPIHTGVAPLVVPTRPLGGLNEKGGKDWDLFKKWGYLSPWYSNPPGTFGINAGPEAPDGCSVTGLHLLHRHGARYPTNWASFGDVPKLAAKLHKSAAKWGAAGPLSFLNTWTYKLGKDALTPFGRQQMFNLGVSMRIKYGLLLEKYSDKLPIFRTVSQSRVWASSINFAIGFFGYPYEDKYQQSILIEAKGFNNSLAPYFACPNAIAQDDPDSWTGYVHNWTMIYLKDAKTRLQPMIRGFDLTEEDLFTFQELCAYETVALGYSEFCSLFTQDEWEGFDYAIDLSIWHGYRFGSPLARAQGIGYIQELVARLTHTPIETHNTSTNSTLDGDSRTFPLDHPLYVDGTHDIVILDILAALNLTTLARSGPLPADRIPENRSFKSSELVSFASNVQFQLLSCPVNGNDDASPSSFEDRIRIIVNDGVMPLSPIRHCPGPDTPEGSLGMCPLDTFVVAMKEVIRETDWDRECNGS